VRWSDGWRRSVPPSRTVERLRRLLVVVPYVVQHPGITLEELGRLFDVDQDQLATDLNLLLFTGLPPYTPGDLIEVDFEGSRVYIRMADYFSRLADYGFDDGNESGSDESDLTPPRILNRSGRVNVAHPHTPGGRMPSRSMEISRPVPDLHMGALATQPAATTAGN
jgi:hypothetical protein